MDIQTLWDKYFIFRLFTAEKAQKIYSIVEEIVSTINEEDYAKSLSLCPHNFFFELNIEKKTFGLSGKESGWTVVVDEKLTQKIWNIFPFVTSIKLTPKSMKINFDKDKHDCPETSMYSFYYFGDTVEVDSNKYYIDIPYEFFS